MSREDQIEVDGVVKEVLQGGMFRVQLENGHEVLAYTSGKIVQYGYDTNGRVTSVRRVRTSVRSSWPPKGPTESV